MPIFNITDLNLVHSIHGLVVTCLHQREFSVMGLFDVKSPRFTLAICETKLEINPDSGEFESAMKGNRLLHGKEWNKMYIKLKEKGKLPLVYKQSDVLTSEEIFLNASVRSKPISRILGTEWIAFVVNYNYSAEEEIRFTALPCHLDQPSDLSFAGIKQGIDFVSRFNQIRVPIQSAFNSLKQLQKIHFSKLLLPNNQEQKIAPNHQSWVQQFSIPYGQNENFMRHFICNKTLSIAEKINIINLQRAQVENGTKIIAQMHADMEMLRLTDLELFNQGKEIHAHLCQLVANILPKNTNTLKVSLEDLTCSITLAKLISPAIAMDGEVYEEKDIKEWFSRATRFPNNEKPLTDKTVTISKLMKQVLDRPDYVITEDDLICPLTHKFMQDPVLARDGLLYERSAIENEFRKNPDYLPSNALVSVNWVNVRRLELLKLIANKQASPQAKKTTHASIMQNLDSEEKLCPTPPNVSTVKIIVRRNKRSSLDLIKLFSLSPPMSPAPDMSDKSSVLQKR